MIGSSSSGAARPCWRSRAGPSVFDFDGAVAARTESFAALVERPHPIPALARKPSYEMLRDRFFAGREDQIDIAQISPRVFEAIALRTLVIAYPGRYSGVLEPWRHYVPLDKDHGNMAQVARRAARSRTRGRDHHQRLCRDRPQPRLRLRGDDRGVRPADRRETRRGTRPRVAVSERADAKFRKAFPFMPIDNPTRYARRGRTWPGARGRSRHLGLEGLARRLLRR